MTLLPNDLINEMDNRGFDAYEVYGENMVVIAVPNAEDLAETIPVMAEFQDDMLSVSAVVAEVQEEAFLPAVRMCNALNAGSRWYKHFVQETPAGTFQVCTAADWIAKALPADVAFRALAEFNQHVYAVERELMKA